MNNIMVAYRPGPGHRFYKHCDYGRGQGWNVRLVGPISGEIVDGEYVLPNRLREEGYEVVVTELPNWSEGRYRHMEYQPITKEG
jgi:hypothetical protein